MTVRSREQVLQGTTTYRPGSSRPYYCGEIRCIKCKKIICKNQWRKHYHESTIEMECGECEEKDPFKRFFLKFIPQADEEEMQALKKFQVELSEAGVGFEESGCGDEIACIALKLKMAMEQE